MECTDPARIHINSINLSASTSQEDHIVPWISYWMFRENRPSAGQLLQNPASP